MNQRPTPSAQATLMFREAAESAEAIERMFLANAAPMRDLVGRLRSTPPSMVITCARGSSDNAATYARYLIETCLGRATGSFGLSVASVYRSRVQAPGALCIAISQSGASPDLVMALQSARAGGAYTVALVNAADSPLAAAADSVIALSAGAERSVAATKSFISSLGALLWLVAAWRGEDSLIKAIAGLPDLLRRAWALDWSQALPLLQDKPSLFTLGRGPGLGAAQEAALKLKETCAIHAEAISTAEVAHGPMALAAPGFAAMMFAQDDATLAGALGAAEEFVRRGGSVLTAGAHVSGACNLPGLDAPAPLQPILQIQSFYRMVAELSILRGLNPDRPPNLQKVTRTV